MNFDDKAWPVTIPKSQEYNWTLLDDVSNPASYTWGADQTAQKVCFRQVIRGVEKSDQNVKYTVYDWGKVIEGLGYHRAMVRVPDDMEKSRIVNISVHTRLSGNTSAVWAHVPWRRRDVNPGQKAIFIHDSKTGKRIENFEIINLNQEFLDVVFEPQTVPGDYEIYYLPYFESFRRPLPWEVTESYVKPYSLCDENWLARASSLPGTKTLPNLRSPMVTGRDCQGLSLSKYSQEPGSTAFIRWKFLPQRKKYPKSSQKTKKPVI